MLGSGVMSGQSLTSMMLEQLFPVRSCHTFDILGQDVNGVGEYFQTKRPCGQRSSWGQ